MFEMTELRGWHLAHLTAFSAHREEFGRCLADSFGADLPAGFYRSTTQGTSRLVRLTRDQYWWIAADDSSFSRFTSQLPPAAGAITRLSAGRVRLRLAGSEAREVLAKGIAIDLHPSQFAVGHSAQTGLHHTGIFLERVAADVYELFVQRTFATSIIEWLKDASLAHGVSGT
jgi:heterotetrameric sarcosine oxidase gamma subunit